MYKIIISFLMLTMLGAGMYAQKGNIKSVKIGNQIWMAKNLDVTTFRNGDPIPEAKTKEQWYYYENKQLPAFCYFKNDIKTKDKYGVIYNRFVADDNRGIAPKGWRVPDRIDWNTLKQNVGGKDQGRKLMSKSGWYKNYNGNNSTGFNAQPAGAFQGTSFRNNYETHFIIANETCAYFSLNSSGNIEDNGSWCVGMYIRCIQDSMPDDNQTEKLKDVSLKYSEAVKSQFVHRIGDYKYGGIIYELWKDEKGVENGMVVSLNDLSRNQAWTNAEGRIGWKARSRDNGLRNSNAINNQKGHSESAAKLCLDYSHEGYDDWFLPAIEDLIAIRRNKDILNASLRNIKNTNEIAPIIYQYWSSTEGLNGTPLYLDFYLGKEFDNYDSNTPYDISTRAVRIFNSISTLPKSSIIVQNLDKYQAFKDTTITDIHGQVWMAKNLDVIRFRNGDIIPQITSKDEWANTKSPAWCFYDNDSLTGKKFGILYNWYAVNDSRGLAPKGWHIPSIEEVHKLVSNLGGAQNAGIELKAKNGWEGLGRGENGTNSTRFYGLPGGYRYWNGSFTSKGEISYWWTVTVSHEYDSESFSLYYRGKEVGMFSHPKNEGMYVRCIKD